MLSQDATLLDREVSTLVSQAKEPVIIRSPDDMARLLLASSPQRAADFARAAHERACWAYDEDLIAFWHQVAALVAQCAPQATPSAQPNPSI